MTNTDTNAPRARPEVESLPAYRPGRSAEQAQADHGLSGAIKLASNELPFSPLPSVAKKIAAAIEEANRYPDHLARELRERIALAHDTSASRVAVGCGTVGLLQQLALAYVSEGDEVVFADPSFEAYPIFTQLSGGAARRVPLKRLTHDANGFAGAMSARTHLVLIAQPNNPTSTAMSGAGLRFLVDAVPSDCVVVVDEAYSHFTTGRHLVDATTLLHDHPNLVVLRTFSKAYGLAGLRVGYAIADPSIVAALDKVLTPFAVNRLGQQAALASLAAVDELSARVRLVLDQRTRLTRELRHRGWSIPDSEANFVFLPSGGVSLHLAGELERSGVVTRPFADTGVRVTVGTADEVDRFLAAFDEFANGSLAEQLHASWQLPTGVEGRAAAEWLDRLDAVEERLASFASGDRRHGLTDPDPGGEERWDEGQVWAHIAEFGDYWLAELRRILDTPGSASVPFGRTKSDPQRIAAIAENRALPPRAQLDLALVAIDELRALLSSMGSHDWSRIGEHPTLKTMDVNKFLGEFLVGHYEQHADQLAKLNV
ncbi:MAG: histidinol-phosphate transaminase [Acidimicrobiales bacterium]